MITISFSDITESDYKARRKGQFLIGGRHPNPHSLPVDRNSVAETELDTMVKFGEPEDPWALIESIYASLYFKVIRVLDALDANKDLAISPWEIATAPAALRRLDSGHDGKFDGEECGFSMGSLSVPPTLVKRARANFMRENPVLAALDSNHDGEISEAEIAESSSALRTLDRSHDGSLTADELMPDQTATQAAVIVMRQK